ncbi:MAG: 50S ribosomal protein L18 [uncultured bacterium]|nr:MAG: 50S ribosomal protein L18 [uncultured bacterium]
MKSTILKRQRFAQRKGRVRAKVTGTATCPRLAVHRSLKHISCQLIDDAAGKTVVAASDVTLKATGKKTDKAKTVGEAIAKAAKAAGVTTAVFDRSGYRYHGRIKALAEAARAAGLQF